MELSVLAVRGRAVTMTHKMKSGFLEKLIGRLGRIDPEEVQNYLLRLAQEKGFLETIFNTIQEGIIVTDSNGRITYLNDRACELFGLDGENAMGKPLQEQVRGLDWKARCGQRYTAASAASRSWIPTIAPAAGS